MTGGTALLVALLGGYLLGSIPFGLLLTRLAGLGDVRSIGSGNIGATNVLRTGRKDIAALTLLLDGGKGAAAALLASIFLGPLAGLVAGAAAVLGHCTCPWLGFRGGKGVATALGTFLGWYWLAGVEACLLWLLGAKLGKRSSGASLLSIGLSPLLFWAHIGWPAALAALAVALLVFFRHRGNITRLLAGTEPKIGQGK